MLSKFETVSQRLNKMIEMFSTVVLYVMTALVIAQAVLRYIFHIGLPWGEEIAKLMMVWIALLCSTILVYENSHIAITFCKEKLPVKVQQALDVIFYVLILAFGVIITVSGFQYALIDGMAYMPASGILKIWLYIPIPISGIFIVINCVTMIVRAVHIFQGKVKDTVYRGRDEEEPTT